MTVTPIDTPERALREATSEALLDAMVQLTHRIHGLKPLGSNPRADELRVQRGLIRAELLRRIARTS